ncbi:MAG TPA: hypothetical protein ENO00_15285 [Deltaproteobacteria bacterium]|nr:hypothetical protein [Deltaproteobacteria bacterium]
MRRLSYVICGIVILCCFMVPVVIASQTDTSSKVIETDGAGVVINNDTALARDNAIKDSLRKAVEQAVGTVISSETVVQNFEVINDNIYARSQGYIQNYMILKENISDGLYRVTIRATVSMGSIKDDLRALGFLMAQKGMPRLMVVIAEQNVGQPRPTFYWDSVDLSVAENVFQSNFLQDGFTFVDRAAVQGELKSVTTRGADLNNNVAARLGKKVDAELVIVGKAFAKAAGNVAGTSMRSLQANVTARAVRTDNGMVIASGAEHGAAVHIDDITGGSEAIKKATEKLAENIKTQIITKWQSEISSAGLVSLTVRQIKSYADFMRLKDSLKEEMRGVKNVYIRKMEAGVAQMDVEYEGSALSLADNLAVKKFAGFSLDVTAVGQNALEVNMVK